MNSDFKIKIIGEDISNMFFGFTSKNGFKVFF